MVFIDEVRALLRKHSVPGADDTNFNPMPLLEALASDKKAYVTGDKLDLSLGSHLRVKLEEIAGNYQHLLGADPEDTEAVLDALVMVLSSLDEVVILTGPYEEDGLSLEMRVRELVDFERNNKPGPDSPKSGSDLVATIKALWTDLGGDARLNRLLAARAIANSK